MGSRGGDSTTTVKNDPWKPAQSFLEQALNDARGMWKAGDFVADPYGGDRVADPSGATLAGQNAVMREAQGGTPGIDAAMGSLTSMMGGNPALARMAKADPRLAGLMSGNNIYRDLDAVKANALGSAVPAAASMFAGSGMIGSTPAMDTVGRAATEAVAPIEYGAWNDAQNRMLSAVGLDDQTRLAALGLDQSGKLGAAGLMPELTASGYLPGQMMQGVGAARDLQAQRELDAKVGTYYEGENANNNNFQGYLNALLGIGGMGGTQQQTAPNQGPGTLGQMAGAGLGGLGTYGALAGMGLGGPLAIGGGLLAGLMGLM